MSSPLATALSARAKPSSALLSKAIDDLIGGVQQLLEAMLGLAAIVLSTAIAVLAGSLLLGALWRLIRIIRLGIAPPAKGRR